MLLKQFFKQMFLVLLFWGVLIPNIHSRDVKSKQSSLNKIHAFYTAHKTEILFFGSLSIVLGTYIAITKYSTQYKSMRESNYSRFSSFITVVMEAIGLAPWDK